MVVVHTCNTDTLEVETGGGSRIKASCGYRASSDQPEPQETMAQNKKNVNKTQSGGSYYLVCEYPFPSYLHIPYFTVPSPLLLHGQPWQLLSCLVLRLRLCPEIGMDIEVTLTRSLILP